MKRLLLTVVLGLCVMIAYGRNVPGFAEFLSAPAPVVGPINGTSPVCMGNSFVFSDATTGGMWSSSNSGVASVSGSGVVSGITTGTAIISYSVTDGTGTTYVTYPVTVNAAIAAISGSTSVCSGSSVLLGDAASPGTWTSSNVAVASIGSSTGELLGITSGVVTITFTRVPGCYRSTSFTVNQTPPPIVGSNNVCVGANENLSDALAGGTWTSSFTPMVIVGSATGIVTGESVGSTAIHYTMSTGCAAVMGITINPLPVAITGVRSLCAGALTTLSDGSPSGAWSSSNTAVAVIASGSGFVTGESAGTAIITYELSATGCFQTTVVTVNALPAAITGAGRVCAGQSMHLSDAVAGGAWSSSNTSLATVATSGLVTGVAAGTPLITYKLSTGCLTITPVTVDPLPSAITGIAKVCAGSTITLIDTSSGGTWSAASGFAALDGSGNVAGISAGTAVVTYTSAHGCNTTRIVTINALPPAISGTLLLCQGISTTLTDISAGGTWTSSDIAEAVISGTGFVAAVTAGNPVISYQLPSTGCIITATMTINPLPAAITGVASVCAGTGTSLTDATPGGAWSSSNVSVASVDGSGNVTSGVAGMAAISYSNPTGCGVTRIVTINGLPATVSGTTHLCIGATTTLSDTPGGTWTSSDITIATVTPAGVVSGIGAGTATVTYSLGTGCASMAIITVNPLPSSVSGAASVCIGLSTALTDAGGGSWSSSNTGVATVDGSGNVTGVVAGTVTITYVLPTGCKTTVPFTVNGLPPAISGTMALCLGTSATLSDAAAGGTWSSGNLAVANITGAGTLITVASGSATITYTSATGCVRTTTIVVNAAPAAITGYSSVCVGSVDQFSDITAGGTWTSSSAPYASIGSSSGLTTGLATGIVTITYKLGTGCMATTVLSVTPSPDGIGGAGGLCAGSSITLFDATAGGAWISANPAIATIGAGTGTVTGISTGTAIITYELTGSCYKTTTMTINAAPSVISGASVLCSGLTLALSDAVSGGTWSSSTPSIAVVGSGSGLVTGGSAGTAKITYTLGGLCRTVTNITVNPLPGYTIGTLQVCAGAITSVSDATTGGVWSAGAPGNATIDGAGYITGISAGTNLISYVLGTGCLRTAVVTVNPLPPAITGPGAVCVGSTAILTDAISGGTWLSGDVSKATLGVTGVVTGVSAGTDTISYKISTGCITTTIVTVEPLPSPISGLASVCMGATTTLTEAAGGSWSSSNAAVAAIDAGGTVTGISAGTATITYTLGTGCIKTILFTVHPLPSAINGLSAICAGNATSLTDISIGGSWSSDNLAVGTISATGIVRGINAGSTHILYTLTTGCAASKTLIVNPLPAPITGPGYVCVGLTTTLTDATTGGTWASYSPSIATIGSVSGLVTGVMAGTSIITYTLATGCKITTPLVVNSLPYAIVGALHVCTGFETPLSDFVAGGTWSSSNTAVGSIGISSGMAYGVAPGTASITYTLGTGCLKVAVLTVNASPAAVTGPDRLCAGSTITLSDATSGGTWSTGNWAIATIGSTSGVVTGVSAGSVSISYSLAAGCRSTIIITVSATPVAIYGTRAVCVGNITSLTDPVAGGTWASSAPGIAYVALTSGNVSGGAAGTATITYTLGGSCYKAAVVTVNASPAPITGITTICAGSTTALSDAVPGGTWSTSNYPVAPITTAGVVTGASPGSVTIAYSLAAGCKTSVTVVINPTPVPISAPAIICIGSYVPLSDATAGGTWVSSNPSIASIGSLSGGVLGLLTGTTTITYSLSSGCYRTKLVTVDPLPAAIAAGTGAICSGTAFSLTDTPAGGHWSSSNAAVAAVGSLTGVVSGISGGTATITYNLATGCTSLTTLTVNQSPAAIVGPANVCVGASIFLSDLTAGGTWHASNGFGSVDGGGNVTGIAPGRDTFSYVVASGCKATSVVSVNPAPLAVTGDSHVCTSSTIELTDASTGGHWTSSDITVATVGSHTGIVTGISDGLATISYSLSSICNAVAVVTVTQNPSAIGGTTYFCVPQSETFTDVFSGGAWSSSDPGVAFASPLSGLITAVTGGTATISYSLPGGCVATTLVTISPMAVSGTINGYSSVCISSTIQLTDAAYGGVWSSLHPAVAVVNPSNGMVTGISEGSDTIFYTVTRYCSAETALFPLMVGPEVTLNEITGNNTVCQYGTDTLRDATPGGTWSSTNPGKATIDPSTGVLSAVGSGLDTVVYVIFSGCAAVERTSVIIDELPTDPHITVHPGSTVCANTQYMNIGAGIPQPVTYVYTWRAYNADINSVSANKQNVLVSFPNAGQAVVTLTTQLMITGCAVTDSFVTNVGSSESPAASITYSAPTFTCTDNTADSYQWGYDNGYTLDSSIIPGETSQTYNQPSPDFSDVFYWVMTNHGGCLQKAYYRTPPSVEVGYTSIENLEFILFPNPANSIVHVRVKGLRNGDDVHVKLFDLLGKEISASALVNGNGDIDVSSLAQGIYSAVLVKNSMRLGARMIVKS